MKQFLKRVKQTREVFLQNPESLLDPRYCHTTHARQTFFARAR